MSNTARGNLYGKPHRNLDVVKALSALVKAARPIIETDSQTVGPTDAEWRALEQAHRTADELLDKVFAADES